jgi:hypothetical protein
MAQRLDAVEVLEHCAVRAYETPVLHMVELDGLS